MAFNENFFAGFYSIDQSSSFIHFSYLSRFQILMLDFQFRKYEKIFTKHSEKNIKGLALEEFCVSSKILDQKLSRLLINKYPVYSIIFIYGFLKPK